METSKGAHVHIQSIQKGPWRPPRALTETQSGCVNGDLQGRSHSHPVHTKGSMETTKGAHRILVWVCEWRPPRALTFTSASVTFTFTSVKPCTQSSHAWLGVACIDASAPSSHAWMENARERAMHGWGHSHSHPSSHAWRASSRSKLKEQTHTHSQAMHTVKPCMAGGGRALMHIHRPAMHGWRRARA
jgi:hypothetical protein